MNDEDTQTSSGEETQPTFGGTGRETDTGGDGETDTGGDGETDIGGDGETRTDLEAAIADNPEAVAAFVRRLDAVNELLDVVELGTSALEDDMVEELAGTAATLAEAGDRVATDGTVRLAGTVGDHGDDLAESLETLVELQRSGVLDELVALADVLSLASNALTDDMVSELARTGSSLGEVADVAAERETAREIQLLLGALGDAGDAGDPQPVGALGLVRATRDPDVRHGLGYLVSVARAVGRRQGGRPPGDGGSDGTR